MRIKLALDVLGYVALALLVVFVPHFVGDFTVFEETSGLAPGARLLVNAGRQAGRPAFVAYGLGGGIVVRTGTPQWASRLPASELDVEVPRVTKRIWAQLSGGKTR